MTIGAGIFLIALGAILRYATNLNIEGVSIDTVGLILMIAGAAGLVIGLFQEVIWSDRRREQRLTEAQRADQERAAEERRNPPPPPRY